jgi:hypothetical protein
LPKNNKTGIVGEKKEAFTFGRKTASASSENSVHLHRNTHRYGNNAASRKHFRKFIMSFRIRCDDKIDFYILT